MANLKTLIFDLDGTLTDPREGILRCFAHSLEQLGIPVPSNEALSKQIGPPVRRVFADLIGSEDEVRVEDALRRYRERYSEIGLFENIPYEGIHEALAELKAQGYELLICTSKPWQFAERILERFALAQYFRAVYGAELDGTRGNKSELLAHLLEKEGLDASRCVMIGDRLHDAEAAHANGTRSLGVLYGFGDEQELRAAGAEALCMAPRELGSVIEGLGVR